MMLDSYNNIYVIEYRDDSMEYDDGKYETIILTNIQFNPAIGQLCNLYVSIGIWESKDGFYIGTVRAKSLSDFVGYDLELPYYIGTVHRIKELDMEVGII